MVPTNVPVNQLFGVRTGMGMGLLTFDWSQISWIGSPLMGEFPFSLLSFFPQVVVISFGLNWPFSV